MDIVTEIIFFEIIELQASAPEYRAEVSFQYIGGFPAGIEIDLGLDLCKVIVIHSLVSAVISLSLPADTQGSLILDTMASMICSVSTPSAKAE